MSKVNDVGNSLNMFDLRDEEQAKEYLKTIGTEYRFACYQEKDPDGCHRLASFLESIQKDFEKARAVFQQTCDEYNHGRSCFKTGQYKMLGRACKASVEDAFQYYKKGCDAGYGPSCCNTALMYQKGMSMEKDFSKAKEYLEKACELNDTPSCHLASAYFIQGKEGVNKDMKKAFYYAKKACEKDHIAACVNLGVMYQKGDGVEKNESLAKEYKDKAKQLHKAATEVEKQIEFGK